MASLEQFIGLGIIQREGFGIQDYATSLPHICHRILNDGQCSQAEEIHFQQTGILRDMVVKLSAYHCTVLRDRNRNVVCDVTRCNNHPTGVNPRVSQRTFNHSGCIHRLPL